MKRGPVILVYAALASGCGGKIDGGSAAGRGGATSGAFAPATPNGPGGNDSASGSAGFVGDGSATKSGSPNPASTCQSGLITLASGLGRPQNIAVDATNVYWAPPAKVPLCGGTQTSLWYNYANGLALNDSDIFFTETTTGLGNVWRISVGGTTATRIVWVGKNVGAIAADRTSVYWLGGGTDGSVMEAPIGGGTPTTLASAQDSPWAIALDATSVYWTVKGAVRKVPLKGGAITTMVSLQQSRGIAVDSTSLYFADYDAGTVNQMPIGGGAPTPLATGQTEPVALAVDSTSIYWTNGDGTVMKAPLEGGTPTMLASGQFNPTSIAVDGTSVYWTNTRGVPGPGEPGGNVMKLTPK
jgi:hypothetical protein